MLAWLVCRTAVNREYRARAELRAQGFEVYVPSEIRWRRHARRKEAVSYPLFARYLFVRAGASDVHRLNATDGIEAVLGLSAGERCTVDQQRVAELMEAETLGLFDRTQERKITFAPGQPVRIVGGPFTGFMAEVMGADSDAKRVRVLLKALGGGKLNVGVEQLEAA
jgi:transcription antitermination factor NusG